MCETYRITEPGKEYKSAVNLAIAAGILACVGYGTAATLVVKSLKTDVPVNRTSLLAVAFISLALHGAYLYSVLFPSGGVQLGVTTMACLFAFVLAFTGTVVALYRHIEALLAPSYPAASVGIIAALLFDDKVTPIDQIGQGLIAHILLAIAAYSIVALAFSQAVLLWIQNYQLKHRHLHDILHLLPPLQTMESYLFDLISIGMVLLTVAIGTGFIYVDDFFAQHLIHKTAFAVGAWCVLWLLLFGRNIWGWRGMVAVKWTLTGFALLTVGYFGTKIVLELILEKV